MATSKDGTLRRRAQPTQQATTATVWPHRAGADLVRDPYAHNAEPQYPTTVAVCPTALPVCNHASRRPTILALPAHLVRVFLAAALARLCPAAPATALHASVPAPAATHAAGAAQHMPVIEFGPKPPRSMCDRGCGLS